MKLIWSPSRNVGESTTPRCIKALPPQHSECLISRCYFVTQHQISNNNNIHETTMHLQLETNLQKCDNSEFGSRIRGKQSVSGGA